MKKRICCRALDREVLAVAVINKEDEHTGIIFDWAVYVGAVKGIDHEKEKDEVARIGSKMRKELAVLIFPFLPKDLYRE